MRRLVGAAQSRQLKLRGDTVTRYYITFFIILFWAAIAVIAAHVFAAPSAKVLSGSTWHTRLNGAAGTENSGITWCSILADGDATITFFTVEYNGSGAEIDTIPDGSGNGVSHYPLRANVPTTISFAESYVDSVRITRETASEVILIWQ